MSFLKRFYSEVGNALSDAYGHVLLGDDAGSSENFVFIARGKTVKVDNLAYRKFDLGMTFICVDGRACVKTVHPTSEAALAGIQPRDILQLAVVLLPDKLELLEDDEEEIAAHALDCEKSGMRTYFDDFRDMFEICSVAKGKNSGTIFDLSNKGEQHEKKGAKFSLRSTTQLMVGRCAGNDSSFVHFDTSPASPSGDVIHPVALVFRRTKNREVGDTSHIGIPSFRLDDECERAASLLTHLAPPSQIAQEKNRSNSLLKRDNGFGLDAVCSPAKRFPGTVDDVETATLRDLIKNSLGLAFVRSSKVVLGLSLHFGSGLVISRLGDGSWSAPSAIGVYGAGLGVQFGLEVAEYIFLIQTNEALEHFKRGEHFTIGGNMGAAIAGHGREAYGAASVGASGDGSKGPSKNNIASVVAYAKSQGLYFGVSLEGSKIFTRDEINNRTYKFIAGNEVSTNDILIGKVPIPREATNLYSTLHR
jgi:lipid-binding SYLF domain-containing protein